MFLKPTQRIVTLAICLLMVTSFSYVAPAAYAANLTSASVTLSDSRPSQASTTYTTRFTFPSTTAIRCIRIQLATTASGAFSAPTALLSTSAAKGTITGGGLTDGNWTLDNTVNGDLRLTAAAPQTPTATAATIPITTITNPSGAGLTNGTFFARLNTYTSNDCSTGATDGVVVTLAVTSGVTITAVVDPILTFTMAGHTTAVKTTITPDVSCSSSATAVSFPSTMTLATTYYCAQRMTVSTNASLGYTVTARGTVAGDDMVNQINGAETVTDHSGSNATPAAFGTPTESFGYTSSDGVLGTGTTTRFAAADTFAGFSNTASEVAFSATPVASETTDIAYGFRFGPLTASGTYQTTLVYTATPLY